MTQTVRLVVDLEVPDHVDTDKLTEAMAEMFPGRVRLAEEHDLIVFFRPTVDGDDVYWGTVPPASVVMDCTSTAKELALPREPGDVYYNAMGEVFGVAGRQLKQKLG